MKYYLDKNVWDAALERVRWIYREFPHVVVGFSGGKDSTVVLNLAIKVATELGRLPVDLLWIDQEAEWQCVADFVRTQMHRPEVRPWWFQMSHRILNATSEREQYLHCWDPAKPDEWLRQKEPDSIHENVYGVPDFLDLFGAIIGHHFAGRKAATIGGVRCEESPTRWMTLTQLPKYKHVTWAKKLGGKRDAHYSFYPIYDWTVSDVWKSIHENNWPYCGLYDELYRRGVPVYSMRVSSLHHETAWQNLAYVQEIERETWNKMTRRLHGVNTVKHMILDWVPKTLPPMFASWREYRDHLLQRLITNPVSKAAFAKRFAKMDRVYALLAKPEQMHRVQVTAMLANDCVDWVKIKNWETRPDVNAFLKWTKNGKRTLHNLNNPLIPATAPPTK